MWHRNNTDWQALAGSVISASFTELRTSAVFGPAVAILPERLDLSLREDAVTIGVHLILCEREYGSDGILSQQQAMKAGVQATREQRGRILAYG